MKLRCIIAVMLLTVIPICAIAQEKRGHLHFNAGVKAGVQAITYNDPKFSIEGYEFDHNNIQSNKIGFTVSPFIRLGLGRFYVQTEATLGITRHSFEFKDISVAEAGNAPTGTATYELETYCIQVPILLGYNFIQEGRFGMSIFTGPRTKFTFTAHSNQDFNHFKYEGLKEILEKRVYYWEFGLGVNIHNVFFDFAYDIGITNAAKHVVSDKEGVKFKSDRKDNILSFSVGVIF